MVNHLPLGTGIAIEMLRKTTTDDCNDVLYNTYYLQRIKKNP